MGTHQVRSAGLRHGLLGWPPYLHLQKWLYLRGLSRVNAALPIIGIIAGDREPFTSYIIVTLSL